MTGILAQSMHTLPPASASGLPLWVAVLIGAAAAFAFAIGAWLVWAGRNNDPDIPARTVLGRWRAGLSLPSRAAVGLSIMLMAYHGAAWVSPWQDRLLMVPREHWWVVVGALTLVVVLTLVMDRLESRP